jgi:hypothetical protein
MQRAYGVLSTGVVLLLQAFSAAAAGFEQDGEIYHFRQKDDSVKMQSSADEQAANPGVNQQQDEQQMLKSLEDQGYVFRPMRKRKTLENQPQDATPENRNPAPQQQVQACPAPADPLTVPQVNPVPSSPYAAPYPVPPTMITPPFGYPYTYPSPYNYPYPAGGAMPFPGVPGGFGMPW